MQILISLVPVLIFTIFLIYLDSFNLIRIKLIILCGIWGLSSAAIAYFLNTYLLSILNLDFREYSRFIAPVVEETLKFVLLFILIKKSKVGFVIDGVIYGFAIGAGFALLENIFYLNLIHSNNLMVWLIRGFGTSIMHGGATSIIAIFAMQQAKKHLKFNSLIIIGLLIAIAIHGIFNQFFLSPLLSTLMMVIIVPVIQFLVFQNNEKSLRNWLEIEFETEVNMLKMIKEGHFSETKTGIFLLSIRDRFSGEMVLDLYCYIELYLELSILAKRNILLKESGIPVPVDETVHDKLKELKALEKSIGKTGLFAISPVLRMSKKDIWKLSLLE